jgi:predicted DNA-binding protein
MKIIISEHQTKRLADQLIIEEEKTKAKIIREIIEKYIRLQRPPVKRTLGKIKN